MNRIALSLLAFTFLSTPALAAVSADPKADGKQNVTPMPPAKPFKKTIIKKTIKVDPRSIKPDASGRKVIRMDMKQ